MHAGLPLANDAAIVAHSAEELQQLMNHFSKACQDFGLTISLKKTHGPGHGLTSLYYHLHTRIGGCL